MYRQWKCTDRSCSTGLRLFCAAYICLFAVAGVVLFRHRSATFAPAYYSSEDTGWPTIESFLTKSDSRWNALDDGAKLDCSSLEDMLDIQSAGSGWTKSVYRVQLRGQPLAIKTVNMRGKDMMKCLGQGLRNPTPSWQATPSTSECYHQAASKIIREVAILTQLAPHDHFIPVLGICVPDASGPVIMMTELGEPLHTIRLLQLSWIERLKIVKGIAEILHRLAHSPLGSLSMNDMRRQQFVLVDNTLKLSDVDDVGIAEPTCLQDDQCAIRANNDSVIEQLICLNNTCKGYNERLNIWRAGQHFIIKQFLPIGAPPFLESHIRDLLDAYERRSASATWDTQRILEATNSLLHLYETHDIDGTRKNYGSRKIPEEV